MKTQHEYELKEAEDERRELKREQRERHDEWVTFWCEYAASPAYWIRRLIAATSHEHAALRFAEKAIKEGDIELENGGNWQVFVEGERYTVTLELKAERNAVQAGTRPSGVVGQDVEERDAGGAAETSST